MAVRLSSPLHSTSSFSACRGCDPAFDMAAPSTPDEKPGFVLAHVQELSTHKAAPEGCYTTCTQHVQWHAVPEAASEAHGIASPTEGENLVAMWSATRRRLPVISHVSTPLVHIPQCRLDVTPSRDFPQRVKIEQVALPGPTVRMLLSHVAPPPDAAAATAATTVSGMAMRHFDDADDWVYSRCLLADFSGLGEEEATRLSDQGRLCCWASVVLTPGGTTTHPFDACFVIHRVVAQRDPESGTCRCS